MTTTEDGLLSNKNNFAGAGREGILKLEKFNLSLLQWSGLACDKKTVFQKKKCPEKFDSFLASILMLKKTSTLLGQNWQNQKPTIFSETAKFVWTILANLPV